MVKKAAAIVVAAPFMTVGLIFCLKELKKETSMSQNFVGGVRKI
jgi:hypothetical protein